MWGEGFKATLPPQLWGTSLPMSVLGFSEGPQG